jgi:hypothetical protein
MASGAAYKHMEFFTVMLEKGRTTFATVRAEVGTVSRCRRIA